MQDWQGWITRGFGKKLKKLHTWNAWTLLLLAVTGIILYVPSFRGATSFIRVGLKYVHIGLGLISLFLLLSYLPFLVRHVKQLAGKLGQHINLWAVLLMIVGWGLSGILLWQDQLMPVWNSTALFWHDTLTWIGIPWAVYHSVSRTRWVKTSDKTSKKTEITDWYRRPVFSRSSFIRLSVGSLLVLLVGPSFYRWIKSMTDTGGSTVDDIVKREGKQLTTAIQPLPASNPPIGGGAKGNFRVYTVTDTPAFDSSQWTFSVSGLVEKPMTVSWEDFLKIPRKVQVSDFHCVTGWSVYQITWEGISLKELLKQAGVLANGKHVKLYSGDGVYTDSLTIEQAHLDDVMVAVLLDGKPIPETLGGPVRLVVPRMYAYKSVKWLQAIEVIEKEHVGYWEVRGYDTDAWVSKTKS